MLTQKPPHAGCFWSFADYLETTRMKRFDTFSFRPLTAAQSLAVSCAVGLAMMVAGCATPPPATVSYTAPPPPPIEVAPAPPKPAPAPAPLVAIPFDEAIAAAAKALFTNAAAVPNRVVVIDPLIDGVSGEQTVASRYIETRIREVASTQFPSMEIRPFTSQNVAQNPLVLVGTFTGITLDNKTVGKPEAYRICLALADLSSDKIVAKGVARSVLTGVDVTRTPYYADTPVWVKDSTVDAYIQTCQGTKPGDPISVVYRNSITTATTIADAIVAYEQRNFAQALELYQRAVSAPSGDQLRVHSGLYLTNWRLGKRTDAEQAFGKIVDSGLANNKLAVKFLFQPGRVEFWSDANVSGPYAIWLRQIATRVAKAEKCLQVVGHTSRSGTEPANEKLSLARADTIKRRLQATAPSLASKTAVSGMGFRENVVGSGADDLTDLQDRRVEFKLASCEK
jgi:outer membrane protein OmpA-like peptidoglycan-associated protein